MIVQALEFNGKMILVVKQYVKRGDIVWSFLGGQVEKGESVEHICIREVEEETGFIISIKKPLLAQHGKHTFLADIIGGSLKLDKSIPDNNDIIDNGWINDNEKLCDFTLKVLNYCKKRINGDYNE